MNENDDIRYGPVVSFAGLLGIGGLLLFLELAGSSTPDKPWPIVIFIVGILGLFFFKKGFIPGIKKFGILGLFVFTPLIVAYVNRMPNWLFLLCFILLVSTIAYYFISKNRKRV